MRVRYKPKPWSMTRYEYYSTPKSKDYPDAWFEKFEDKRTGPGACEHFRVNYDPTFEIKYDNTSLGYWKADGGGANYFGSTFLRSLCIGQVQELGLNRNKLSTSSTFDALAFIGEADDLAASFSLRALRRGNPLGVQFDTLPLIADILGLVRQARDLSNRNPTREYEDQFTFGFSTSGQTDGGFNWTFEGESKSRLTGTYSLDDLNPLLVGLDRLGIHPDLNVVWELVPLSFVVDYFYDIGSRIENIVQRGWVTHIVFSGWKTYHVVGHFSCDSRDHRTHSASVIAGNDVEYFRRERVVEVLSIDREFPAKARDSGLNLRQQANTAAIGLGRLSRRLPRSNRRARRLSTALSWSAGALGLSEALKDAFED